MEASFVLALISSSCTWRWQTFATASGGLLNAGSHAKEELLHTGFLCLQIGLDTVSRRLPWPGWTISSDGQYKGQASVCVLPAV